VAFTAGFTDFDILVVDVAYLTDGSHTVGRYVTKLARRKTEEGVNAFFSHKLRAVARRSCKLAASAGIKLYVVNDCTYGDIFKSKRVSRFDVGAGACHYGVADFKTYGLKDVSLFTVFIFEKGDESRTVGIILNALYRCGHSDLVSLKINYTILCANAAAAMTDGDSSVAVTAAVLLVL
jgi:hypothetical protein